MSENISRRAQEIDMIASEFVFEQIRARDEKIKEASNSARKWVELLAESLEQPALLVLYDREPDFNVFSDLDDDEFAWSDPVRFNTRIDQSLGNLFDAASVYAKGYDTRLKISAFNVDIIVFPGATYEDIENAYNEGCAYSGHSREVIFEARSTGMAES